MLCVWLCVLAGESECCGRYDVALGKRGFKVSVANKTYFDNSTKKFAKNKLY